MDQDDELAESKSKTYQLIGRNIILFQQMEHLLKSILPRATITLSSDTDATAMMKQRYATVEKCTLGNLVNRFIDEIGDPREPDLTTGSSGVIVQATVRTIFDAAHIQRLNDLVDGRNHLVHHLILEIDANSAESWRATHLDLENQQQQVISEIEGLRQFIDAMRGFLAWVAHPEVLRELVYGPIREQLINQLETVAQESTDPDGWTSLKSAIKSEGFLLPTAITELREGYQAPTVSSFLETLGHFELRHDKNRKGGTNTFYRVATTQTTSASDPGEEIS